MLHMKRGIKQLGITVMLAFGCIHGYSQEGPTFDKMVDILPPAPNATAIIKYGNTAINKNTGAPQINIPLYTVKGIKLSTNISLGYSSAGIRVDEIASRVGMGWSINAGGVVTRTVRGVPDEWNTRHYPYGPIGTNWNTFNFMNRIAGSAGDLRSGYDSEPDLFNFSFDGQSGSFVLGNNGLPVQINKSGIKIITNFTSTSWNFKIVTTDGTIYLFGGTGAVEKTKREQSCGRTQAEHIPTSWYLKEIQHPNGEKIQFNYTAHSYKYDNGVSQTMYRIAGYSGTCIAGATNTCINSCLTDGVLLTSIVSPDRTTVSFDYTTRQDCTDKLISKITYSNPSGTISSTDFTYTNVVSTGVGGGSQYYYSYAPNTPYLTALTENSSDNAQHRTHYFSYIDPEGRPQRLCYAQDHWGYYNGKNNTSFTPDLGGAAALAYPDAKANKEADHVYAQKGMLQKIVYPTGGVEMLFYEANKFPALSEYSTRHTLTCGVTGTGFTGVVTRSKTFHIDDQVFSPRLTVVCQPGTGTQQNVGHVKIKDLATNTVTTIHLCGPGDPLYTAVQPAFTPGDYELIIDAAGSVVSFETTLEFRPTYYATSQTEKEVGGLRVSKIISSNLSEAPVVKKYYYGTYDDLNSSSMSFLTGEPHYISDTKCSTSGMGVSHFGTINSSSLMNLSSFSGSPVSYNSVVESIGDNFEGGGTETKFYTGSDGLGEILWGNDILSSPMNNYSSLFNAKPYSETILKKMTDGSLKPVKKTAYTYVLALEDTIPGYTIVSSAPNHIITVDTTCDISNNPDPNNPINCYGSLVTLLSAYDMVKYRVHSTWVHPDETIETLYDQNGENPVVTTTKTYYANSSHYQVTKTEVTNSKGQLIRTTNKYPFDYSNTGDYEAMIGANIITPVINSKTEIVNTSPTPNTVIAESQVDYALKANSNYVPVQVQKAVKGNALEPEGTIDQYDTKGNILQFTSKAGITSSIIWGYNYQYPVAQVTGADYSSAAAQLSVTMAALQSMDGAALRTELNRIRTGIPAARVTTYTYKPQTGVTSITDAENKTNTYEYDAFNRLVVVKDQDGNAVKKNEYVYATPDPNSGVNVYLNQQLSESVNCTTCAANFAAEPVVYTVTAGRYYSLTSQAAADALAAADLSANKQQFANMNATCTNTSVCNGNGNKFVGCGCEQGVMAFEYCGPVNNDGTWTNYYHYTWSDGSTSGSFGVLQPACTGVDKKKVGCNCETGVRECVSAPVNNGNGTWTLNYRYRFSDNSTSSTITETIACSGVDKKIINCECVTGYKVYTNVQACGKGTVGCCPGMAWVCTYHWAWRDGSYDNTNYTECSNTNCMGGIGGQ